MLLVALVTALSVASAQDPNDPNSASGRTPVSMDLLPSEGFSCIRDQQTLTATASDNDGVVANTRVEFMLNRFPGAVGDIVDVNGRNPAKMDNAFGVANTNGSGQAQAVITSTRVGQTDYTAYVPAIRSDAFHKEFGVMNWVDPCPTFPGDAENPTGQPHPITIAMNNVSDGAPVAGIPVRFRITDDEPNAQFQGATGDGNFLSVVTDGNGIASVVLEQAAPVLGDNSVYIEVLSPDDKVMFHHALTKTWKSPVLSVTASGPATIGLLREGDYAIEVTNSGDFLATGVTVTMDLPAGLGYADSVPEGTVAPSDSGQTVTWDVGEIPVDGTSSITLTAAALLPGLHTSNVSVTSAEDSGSETSVSTTVVPGVLEVRASGPDQVDIGANATYDIRVVSSGTGANTQIRLIQTVPEGMTFVSADREATQSGNQIVFDLGTLTQGELADVAVTLQAEQAGSIDVTTTVTSAEGGSDETSVTTQVVRPLLSINKTGPQSALLGSRFDYNVSVANTGDGAAYNVTVTDTLPDGIRFISASPTAVVSGQTLTWNLGTLASGATDGVSITVAGSQSGSHTNVATVDSEGPYTEPREDSATTVVLSPSVELAISGPPLYVGNAGEYRITATNTGETTLTNAVVTSSVPDGMMFVSTTPAVEPTEEGGILWPIGDIPIGEERSVVLSLQADEEGSATLVAGVATDEGPTASASLDITVRPAVGGDISLIEGDSLVREGDEASFTFAVNNGGRSAMTNVMVSVTIPGALTYASASASVDGVEPSLSDDGTVVSFNLGDIAVGGQVTITVATQANDLPEGGELGVVTRATLTYNEFAVPISAEAGTTVIER